jgi:hypothetical protein
MEVETMMASLLHMAALLAAASQEPVPAAPADAFARIDRWVHDWQPTAEDRRMEEIGWAKDIPEAIRLSKKNGRPVFVFIHKGRINIGRM